MDISYVEGVLDCATAILSSEIKKVSENESIRETMTLISSKAEAFRNFEL